MKWTRLWLYLFHEIIGFALALLDEISKNEIPQEKFKESFFLHKNWSCDRR